MNFENQWALVTGASSGIGEQVATSLAKRGANLILTARRADRLDTLANFLIKEFAIEVRTVSIDLSESKSAQRLYETVLSFNIPVTILINNAGAGKFGKFVDFELDDHLANMHLNVTSLVELCYLFSDHMLKHKKTSSILNVASIIAFASVPNYAVYGGTKRFVRHFSETLTHEFLGTNIHVSCLCPGGTQTEFFENSQQHLKKGSQKVMMSAQDVAELAIEAIERKKTVSITGFINQIACLLPRFLTTDFTLKVGKRVMDRAAKSKVESKL